MSCLENAPRSAAGCAILLLLGSLTACGGGGGGGSSSGGPTGWVAGVFQPSASFAAKCASPRTGTDPATNMPYPDVQGTATTENNWLRSWTNELYLWYREVPDQNPANYATPDYFNLLKTSATTPSGAPKDKFHFTYNTAQWEALSQSGVQVGYGAQWAVIAAKPPRQVVVAYTEPGSNAVSAPANLARGAEILAIDGLDLVNDNNSTDINTLNADLSPTTAGVSHSFTVQDLGASTSRTFSMSSETVTSAPVQDVMTISTGTGTVGYMLFNDHLATAEQALIDAVNTLKAANISDLVLDIRYNGGGYLDIASEAAYMIAGAGPTAGRTFELTQFNDKHPTTDPVTGNAITPVPFHTTTQGFSTTAGQALPTLNLARVYVLTGPDTCSASESIINSLRGVGVQVIQIGSTTCGKPYGFYPQDNCGTTYFSIEFRGVNDAGFGDYSDGFSPQNSTGTVGTTVPGCSVADDYTHALGDQNEGRLAAALGYRANATCPSPPTGIAPPARATQLAATDGKVIKAPWLENRILRPMQ